MTAEKRRRGREIRKTRRRHPSWHRSDLQGVALFHEALASVTDTFEFFGRSLDAHEAEQVAQFRARRALNYRDDSGQALYSVSSPYRHPRSVLTRRH